jgi:hypothetical protein
MFKNKVGINAKLFINVFQKSDVGLLLPIQNKGCLAWLTWSFFANSF